jgi:hypothetical protein
MNSSGQTRPRQAPSVDTRPTFGEALSDALAPMGAIFVAGPPVVVAAGSTVLLALMLCAPFVLLVTLVVALVAATVLVAFAGTLLVTPYVLTRSLHRRVAKRRQSKEGYVPVATVIAQTGKGTKRGVAPFTEPATTRGSQ